MNFYYLHNINCYFCVLTPYTCIIKWIGMPGLKIKFSVVFACYMFFMVFIPCADACGIDSHEQSITMESANDHHQEHLDLCSPFCSCSCCATQITISPLLNFEITMQSEIRTFVIIDNTVPHTLYFSIWQPPKIS